MTANDLKKIVNKVGIYVVSALIYSLIIFFFTSSFWDFLFFLIGAILGVSFTMFDEEYLFSFYQDKDLDKNFSVKKFFVTRSPLYILALIPTAIFVFTSSGSFFAMGFMGGLILFFIVEMFRKLANPSFFFAKFLAGVKVEPTKQSLQKIIAGSVLFFLILHLLVLL
ncbi:MAG: hypothetical protein ACOZAK_04485 [Patescibacteria group bacterium]